MERQQVSSGSPYEPLIGFSRAAKVGRHVFVSSTAPIMPDGSDPPSDTYGQAVRCLEIIVEALRDIGAQPSDVVRTRVFLTDPHDWREAGRAHGEVFGDARPANGMIVVRGFVDPRWRIEIEADAIVNEEGTP